MVNSSTTQAYYSTWQFILNEKRKPTKLLLAFFPTCLTLFLLSFNVNGQNSLTLSTQAIHSKVEVKDNWSPPYRRAPERQVGGYSQRVWGQPELCVPTAVPPQGPARAADGRGGLFQAAF